MPDATINGFKHHWEEAGSGDALVMLHGGVSSGRSLTSHLAELSKSFRVLIPDMRSMGQSEHVTSIPPSAWIDDLLGLLDHLGIDSAHLYGGSLGARVAVRFAIDHPTRTRTVIVDNMIVANAPHTNEILNARWATPESMAPEVAKRYESLHGADWQDVVHNYFNIRNEDAWQEYFNLHELSRSVTAPTLITRGDNRADVIHPLPHAIELFNNIETSRLWIKPEGGCLATPEGYEVIRRFTKETAAKRSLAPASSVD